MLKLLMIAAISASLSFGNINFHDFLIRSYQKNENIKVNSVKITKIKEISNGFFAYFVSLELKFLPLDRKFIKNDLIFVNGNFVVGDIINLKTNTSLRDELLDEKVNITFEKFKKGFEYEKDKNCN